jgi:phosphoglycolate phosphatase
MPVMLTSVIRAIIFDLDGTLVHSLSGIAKALNTILEHHQLPTHSQSTVRTFIGDGIVKLVERACPDGYDPGQMAELTGEVSNEYATAWRDGTVPYTGVNETLTALLQSGTKIAVLSNKPHAFCQQITDLIFPDITFTAVVGQHQGVPTKPDPTGALDLAKLLHVSPEEIAFVGDSTVDIATAHNAGMISVAATWGYHDLADLISESPTHRIDGISELLDTLNNQAP